MVILALLPAVLSLLVLAAHFLRAGSMGLVVLFVAATVLPFVKRRWAMWTVQVLLFLGGLEWVGTTVALAAGRRIAGEPWARMGLILGAVALVTFASILAFRIPAVKRRYER